MSGFTVISSSEIYKDVIVYLDNGRGTTKEKLILQKNGVTFEVNFDLPFMYDWSNGLVVDEPKITRIMKSNKENETESEVSIIKYFIKQSYK